MPVTQITVTPAVTVVIPTYNGARFIGEAIESCLQQAHETFSVEVIVVDDASQDNTVELVSTFAGRVTLLPQSSNQGRHIARNIGLAAASGTYVKFLDQDDLLEPETLQAEHELARETQADIVIAGHRNIASDGHCTNTINEHRSPRSMEPRVSAVLDGAAVPTAAALYRRTYIDGLAWDGDVPRLDDWDWFVRAALRMGKIVPIHHVSYSWRHHSGQYTHSSTLNQYARDHHIILKKIECWLHDNGEFTQPHRARLAQYYYKMLRAIYKHDRAWYQQTLAHIFELDPSFQPYCEPRRGVRGLCQVIGVRAGLFVYNHVADAAQTIRSFGRHSLRALAMRRWPSAKLLSGNQA